MRFKISSSSFGRARHPTRLMTRSSFIRRSFTTLMLSLKPLTQASDSESLDGDVSRECRALAPVIRATGLSIVLLQCAALSGSRLSGGTWSLPVAIIQGLEEAIPDLFSVSR